MNSDKIVNNNQINMESNLNVLGFIENSKNAFGPRCCRCGCKVYDQGFSRLGLTFCSPYCDNIGGVFVMPDKTSFFYAD